MLRSLLIERVIVRAHHEHILKDDGTVRIEFIYKMRGYCQFATNREKRGKEKKRRKWKMQKKIGKNGKGKEENKEENNKGKGKEENEKCKGKQE